MALEAVELTELRVGLLHDEVVVYLRERAQLDEGVGGLAEDRTSNNIMVLRQMQQEMHA